MGGAIAIVLRCELRLVELFHLFEIIFWWVDFISKKVCAVKSIDILDIFDDFVYVIINICWLSFRARMILGL